MAKLTLSDILGAYASTTELNNNFALIEDALENTVSRDGTTPNTMSADLDLNSNNINNVNTVNTVALQIGGVSVVPGDVLTVDTAANVPSVPAGGLAATDVQSALNELDTEKVNVAGTETITGDKTLSGTTELSGATTVSGTAALSSTVSVTGNATFDNPVTIKGASPLVFEGVTEDAFETTLAITDPTSDKTITLPDSTGTVALERDLTGVPALIGAVAFNDLNITLSESQISFIVSGAGVVRSGAASLTVPNGATLGTTNNRLHRLYILAFDDSGTIELGVVNEIGRLKLDETDTLSTTAIGTGSDLDNVVYSTSAMSSKRYRVVGYLESTQATAGTWITSVSADIPAGTIATSGMASVGNGQAWQSVTRTSGTTYYNDTGRPIQLSVDCIYNAGGTTIAIDGVTVAVNVGSTNDRTNATHIIPNGASYVLTDAGSASHIATELR